MREREVKIINTSAARRAGSGECPPLSNAALESGTGDWGEFCWHGVGAGVLNVLFSSYVRSGALPLASSESRHR